MKNEKYDLNNNVCVVAGASSGIGREIALELSKCGATVICAARRKENLKDTVSLIEKNGGVAEALDCDFLNPESVDKLAGYVFGKYKKIDLWLNGVGVNNAMGITWELSFDEWLADLNGNVKTCYSGTVAAIKRMKEQGFGRIINMSGGGVVKPETYNSAYAAGKTALVRFTECVALELTKENVPVKIFAFNPGLVRTERTVALVNKPETLKFMPGIIDKIKNDDAMPINVPAQFVAFLATGALDELHGCLLSAEMDMDELFKDKKEIVDTGKYKIKVKGYKVK